MNFDTKYLIRWGIPGWIMIMALFPYLFVTFIDGFKEIFKLSAVDILTIGATLTFLGVPLGYVLNQVHHSLFWVLPSLYKREWKIYFKQEVSADEKHLSIDEFKKERYRYLLSKKHELGGVAVSLFISWAVILIMNISINNLLWSWIYFGIVTALTILVILSRNYSSRNVHYYFYDYLLKETNEIR
ncbi:hypothetical protein [Lysinibacillus sp. FSL M8-0134]|uniref:hypothetical protein n=1 Tax=Lysinibacillus sp. FSL M8-0134 TaxID=2921717 RepID=UPI00311A446D